MIPLLPRWNLRPNRPSFYDADSATLLELASTLHESMNALIKDYNDFVENVEKNLTEFMQSTNQNQEVFQVAIRQEFQDFINIVDTKITGMNNTLEATIKNMEDIARRQVNSAIQEGRITITQDYNEETESLNLVLTGEV